MVAAVGMCKDEADIAEHTLRRMAHQVDFLIVADNNSTDGTRAILDSLADELPLTVLDDHEPAYYQAAKMTGLAETAASAGADWIIAADLDEVWLPRPGGRIRDVLGSLDDSVLVAEAPLLDHVATGQDPEIVDPVDRMRWRRSEAAPLRKVAVRYREGLTIHQGNHSATFDGVPHPPTVTNALEVRHFPLRSVAQMIRKARNGGAAYAATDLPCDVGAHWRGWSKLSDDQLGEVFREYYWSAHPEEDGLLFDPVDAG